MADVGSLFLVCIFTIRQGEGICGGSMGWLGGGIRGVL
jgi:hypothetical protein